MHEHKTVAFLVSHRARGGPQACRAVPVALIGSERLIHSVLSVSPCKELSSLLFHTVGTEERDDGRRCGGVKDWRDRVYWAGGVKQEMTILGT